MAAISERIPPLGSGDHLSWEEFERRLGTLPRGYRAELVEGVVFTVPPVKHEGHGKPHSGLGGWLMHYAAFTTGVEMSDNATLRCDSRNIFQPDALLRLEERLGGKSQVSEDDYLEGAPELIAEVAGTSAAQDLHEKLRVYERIGVREYIVWQVHDRKIDWFELRRGKYERLTADSGGLPHSNVFPGLVLDAAALLQGDLARVLTVLQQSLAQPSHAAFVRKLAERGQ